MMENLFTKDPEHVIPKDFNSTTEEEYFDLLKSQEVGKALTNLSEFLLETEGMTGKSKVIIRNHCNYSYRILLSGLD